MSKALAKPVTCGKRNVNTRSSMREETTSFTALRLEWRLLWEAVDYLVEPAVLRCREVVQEIQKLLRQRAIRHTHCSMIHMRDLNQSRKDLGQMAVLCSPITGCSKSGRLTTFLDTVPDLDRQLHLKTERACRIQ